VANPVSHSTTTNKVVLDRTSTEVNLLSRVLFKISLTELKVEAELRSKKEEENLGMASPKDISDTHLLPCSAAILDDLPDKMGD
jgi:hypothetical protein